MTTIAAIATPAGHGAIGIVRISGPKARDILDAVVPSARAGAKPRRVLFGRAVHPSTGEILDEVLCFYCPGPRTATGEDTAELHGHGGPVVLESLLGAAFDAGASPAQPGEFSYRAFTSGRIDLTQAEAIMGLIGARSERAARMAARQLSGALQDALGARFDELSRLSARLEVGLDYPDEDLPEAESNALCNDLGDIKQALEASVATSAFGGRLTGGAQVAIVGPPNAGKSSLLNRLVRRDRALVDAEPGTTRDVVEAQGECGGIPLTFLDTAGLREGAGRVERRGIEKAVETARAADLVIVVLDGTEAEGFEAIASRLKAQVPVVVAVNKCDLDGFQIPKAPLAVSAVIALSARTGQGLGELEHAMAAALGDSVSEEAGVLTTARQTQIVADVLEQIEGAMGALSAGEDPEIAAAQLHFARHRFAELWGRDANEDMLSALFSSFCLGK